MFCVPWHVFSLQAFGVGAFEEEDENVYCMDDMSDYDFAMSSEKESNRLHNLGWTGPPKKDKSKGDFACFAVSLIVWMKHINIVVLSYALFSQYIGFKCSPYNSVPYFAFCLHKDTNHSLRIDHW